MSDTIQQSDLVELLDAAFPTITIIGEDRGATEADADIALAPRHTRGAGKIPGMVIVVAMPGEEPEKPAAQLITYNRVFPVRVIEAVAVNRPPGVGLATGYDAGSAKQAIVELLHARGISGGTLSYTGAEPFSDGKGGIGYTLSFRIVGGYALPQRSSNPLLTFANDLCTIEAGAGADILYTLDGTTPLGAAASVYVEPFAVTAGDLVRASAKEADVDVSDFIEEVAP